MWGNALSTWLNGSIAAATLEHKLPLAVLIVCAQLAVTLALTRVAIGVAIRVVTPRLLLATAPANLRTE
jgi:hypothetical protein